MITRTGAVLALQGYQAISDLSTGTIARFEVGTGIKHAHADYHEQDIRRNNYIGGKNGYNTEESLELDRRADRLEKTAFYVDLALGSLYGWGNTDAIKYVGTAVATDPVVRAATAPEQIWLTTCKRDSLYCSNFNRDDSKRPTENGRAEIGDKRQIFDIS